MPSQGRSFNDCQAATKDPSSLMRACPPIRGVDPCVSSHDDISSVLIMARAAKFFPYDLDAAPAGIGDALHYKPVVHCSALIGPNRGCVHSVGSF
ncbi:Usherin [Dissostichus eleginoides]|uniref:Usherin n=1 Tax=Dissostichus eleginoides TaxID=100907 RepID=A0AAD9CMC8_DISEL|nr:Usherin [Dissostichus eleginoides]